MTRGGILNSDIIRCACGKESEFSACNRSAMNSTKLATGSEGRCANPCLFGAISGLSLKLPMRGVVMFVCLGLIRWVFCWLGELTWAHSVGLVPGQQGHRFLRPTPSSRSSSRTAPSLQSCLCHFPFLQQAERPQPLPPYSSKQPAWPGKAAKSHVLTGELSSFLFPAGSHFSFPLLLTPRSRLVLKLKRVSKICLCHLLS